MEIYTKRTPDSEDGKEEEAEAFVSKSYWFKGECYPQRGLFKGTWGENLEEHNHDDELQFQADSLRDVKMKVKLKGKQGWMPVKDVKFDLRTLTFDN